MFLSPPRLSWSWRGCSRRPSKNKLVWKHRRKPKRPGIVLPKFKMILILVCNGNIVGLAPPFIMLQSSCPWTSAFRKPLNTEQIWGLTWRHRREQRSSERKLRRCIEPRLRACLPQWIQRQAFKKTLKRSLLFWLLPQGRYPIGLICCSSFCGLCLVEFLWTVRPRRRPKLNSKSSRPSRTSNGSRKRRRPKPDSDSEANWQSPNNACQHILDAGRQAPMMLLKARSLLEVILSREGKTKKHPKKRAEPRLLQRLLSWRKSRKRRPRQPRRQCDFYVLLRLVFVFYFWEVLGVTASRSFVIVSLADRKLRMTFELKAITWSFSNLGIAPSICGWRFPVMEHTRGYNYCETLSMFESLPVLVRDLTDVFIPTPSKMKLAAGGDPELPFRILFFVWYPHCFWLVEHYWLKMLHRKWFIFNKEPGYQYRLR